MKNKQATYALRIQQEQPVLTMECISDLHVYAFQQDKMLLQALEDIWERGVRHLIIGGDISNNGLNYQLRCALLHLKEYPFHYACALGNHDLYHRCSKQQMHIHHLYKELMLNNQHQLYVHMRFNGYPIYVLNSEKPQKDMPWFSNNQLQWIQNQFKKLPKDTPAFVVCHQPLMNTHSHTDEATLTIGAQSKQLYDILSSHPNVIYICGHTHNSYQLCDVIQKDSLTSVMLPPFRFIKQGEKRPYIGYHFKIYHDFIHIKTRDYQEQSWILSHEFIIDLHHHRVLPFVSS